MYVGHTYKKSKNMTCNIQKKYIKNIKMKNLVHVVNLSLDYWTLNGMPTINNEIFFLSLYQYIIIISTSLSYYTNYLCTHCHLSQKNTLSSSLGYPLVYLSSSPQAPSIRIIWILSSYSTTIVLIHTIVTAVVPTCNITGPSR